MDALGEGQIGVLSDGGSIPLTSTRKMHLRLRVHFLMIPKMQHFFE